MTKKITIKKYRSAASKRVMRFADQEMVVVGEDDMEVSDGYHTLNELYDHRITLFIALCKQLSQYNCGYCQDAFGAKYNPVWRSKLHSDGSSYDGWFILGIDEEKGKQISYHLPLAVWAETEFAETLNKAPEWDGHTPKDVLERLKTL